jgi:hypothetical protein
VELLAGSAAIPKILTTRKLDIRVFPDAEAQAGNLEARRSPSSPVPLSAETPLKFGAYSTGSSRSVSSVSADAAGLGATRRRPRTQEQTLIID